MITLLPAQRKRLFFYALLCTCIGIWGFVLYEVVQGLSTVDDTTVLHVPTVAVSSGETETVVRPGSAYVYKDDYRDPFEPPAALFPAPQRSRTGPALPAPEPPPLTLSGVVDGTALLQGEDGSSYVVREGEHAAGARLIQVRSDHVVLRYEGRSVTLRINQ